LACAADDHTVMTLAVFGSGRGSTYEPGLLVGELGLYPLVEFEKGVFAANDPERRNLNHGVILHYDDR
jgi:hypothetical protein